jgi:hypothetical protein
MTDTEITLNVSLISDREYITELDFLDLDWYNQELNGIFRDHNIPVTKTLRTK